MDERRDPQTNAPDEGELLAAYLDADTDDVTSARIERRLREDPRLAAKLDALAHARVRLQRLDAVTPPPDFRQRLDARLQTERGAQDAGIRAPSVARHSTVPSRARRRWWAPAMAAAALVFGAVIGLGALLNLLPQAGGEESAGADMARETSGEGAAAPLAAPESAEDDAVSRAEADESTVDDQQMQRPGATGATQPQVASDADIAGRLRQRTTAVSDPTGREADLRAAAGLPTERLCLAGIEADAVDLVERDGVLVLTARLTGAQGDRVVVFDPETCARLRTFGS